LPWPSQRRRLLQAAAPLLAPAVRGLPDRIERVLLVRPDHVGDVLLSSPAVALLRTALPRARLTYLVGPWAVDAARHGPAVDEVRTLRFPGFTRTPKQNVVQPYALLARWALRLRRERYDLAVMLRGDHWWGGLLALAAGIPVRVGGLAPEKTGDLLTHGRAAGPHEHWAEQALGIARLALEACGAPVPLPPAELVFRVSEPARAVAAAWLREHGLAGQRVVAIHPSAGAGLKSWPVQRWATVADRIEAPVVLTGGPGDQALLRCIAQHTSTRVVFAAGQRLEVSAALYERCALLIAPDCGAAHLAGAVGTPTLRLYGPASEHVFGPWPARDDQRVQTAQGLACAPCGYLVDPPCGATHTPACMLSLSTEQVLQAAKDLLARTEN
jgi:ADP-heptose:LPS heptosyltransferase